MMFSKLSENRVLSIGLTIILLLLVSYLSYLLVKKILKEREIEKQLKQSRMEGVISKSEMDSLIATYIAQVGTTASFGLIYIDLDKFAKYANIFNDKDVSLIFYQIIRKLKQLLPKDVKVSRYIGDEFLVMFSQRYKREDVEGYAKSLVEAFREPLELYEGTKIDQKISLAVAYYPLHGNKVKDLIKSLKLVIYKIKKRGGNNYSVYSNQELKEDQDRVDYYYEVKNAIENKQFTLYYQPIIEIETGNIYAIESLLRWNHPSLGLLTPNKFMPIMEQTGDIYWVGLWGLEELIINYFKWQELGLVDVYPTINISSKQLMYNNITKDFINICRKYKVQPEKIILEIDEFTIFDTKSEVFNNLTKLKQVGFKVAVDGYGIDFNALEQMELMNIDAIKFKYSVLTSDKSYVANKMLETILSFIKKNKKILIVQDIENNQMLKDVEVFETKFGQGYNFSKVLSEENMKEFIKNQLILVEQSKKI